MVFYKCIIPLSHFHPNSKAWTLGWLFDKDLNSYRCCSYQCKEKIQWTLSLILRQLHWLRFGTWTKIPKRVQTHIQVRNQHNFSQLSITNALGNNTSCILKFVYIQNITQRTYKFFIIYMVSNSSFNAS